MSKERQERYKKMKQDERNLANFLKEKGFFDKITLKKVKTEIGHDLCGYYFDFYLKGHGKIGYVNNDGWGGHVEPTYENNKKQAVFEKLLKDADVEKAMAENGWAFMKKEIDINTQVLSLLEMVLNNIDTAKFEKKRTQTTEKGIVFGTDGSYKSVSYKIPLKAVAMHKGGVKVIQDSYNRIKKNLKPNEKIFNENLEDLGIKL